MNLTGVVVAELTIFTYLNRLGYSRLGTLVFCVTLFNIREKSSSSSSSSFKSSALTINSYFNCPTSNNVFFYSTFLACKLSPFTLLLPFCLSYISTTSTSSSSSCIIIIFSNFLILCSSTFSFFYPNAVKNPPVNSSDFFSSLTLFVNS